MSALPKRPEPEDWLKAAATELHIGDKATLKLLQEAYREVNKSLKDLPDDASAPLGALVQRAQAERVRRELLNAQATLFTKLGDLVSARRLKSASRAAKLSAAADAAYLNLVGEGEAGKRLYDGADITSQRTVETILARIGLSKVPLSERIYNTNAWMNGRLDRLIAATMAQGLNAKRFAKVARDWFAPSVPGGTRYAALRLARTEINNAFHATSIDYAQSKPWVSRMEWILSKSHTTPDKCNEYAELSPWPVHAIPRKPHPQCMCTVAEAEMDEDEWIDRFVKGEFDEYLDNELAKADGKAPQATKTATGSTIKTQTAPASSSDKPPLEAKLNALSQTVYDQLEIGTKLDVIGRPDISRSTVAKITGKSVFFTDGKHENLRSLFHYKVVTEEAAKYLVGDAAQAIVPKGLFKRGSMDEKSREALKTYESGWFSVIQAYLREQQDVKDQIDRETAQTITDIDRAMAGSALPEPVQVWRGMFGADKLFGDLDRDLTGFSWSELGYGSTTTEEKVVDLFQVRDSENPRFKGKNVKLVVFVDAGVRALQTSTAKQGSKTNGAQAEITLQRGLKWTVTKDLGVDPATGSRNLEVRVSLA